MKQVLIVVILAALGALPALAKGPALKSPAEAKPGVMGEWKSEGGLVYQYRLPKSWDAKKGANLVVILHGSNLDRRWGFANHAVKTFRPNDIVVSPDGTTSNGRGGFNSLGKAPDVKRFQKLLEELKDMLTIKQVYLYGHSQGSFFAIHYAGERPKDIDGLVAHASGVWTWSTGGKKGHHQAVCLMHGTQDPVVPYGQSVGGLEWFEDHKYPTVRLFSLEGWNHWPAEHNGQIPHTSQEIAWCIGMTAKDPADAAAEFAFLADVEKKEVHDWAALYQVAARIAGMEDAPAALKSKAASAMKVVEALAAAHIAALPEKPSTDFSDEDWVGHLPVFLRAFHGVPAADAYRETWARTFEKLQKTTFKHLKKYWAGLNGGDKREAFLAGVEALEVGFLHYACWDRRFLSNLAAWRKEAKDLKIPKKTLKAYDGMVKELGKARKDGWKAYAKIQNKAGKV